MIWRMLVAQCSKSRNCCTHYNSVKFLVSSWLVNGYAFIHSCFLLSKIKFGCLSAMDLISIKNPKPQGFYILYIVLMWNTVASHLLNRLLQSTQRMPSFIALLCWDTLSPRRFGLQYPWSLILYAVTLGYAVSPFTETIVFLGITS